MNLLMIIQDVTKQITVLAQHLGRYLSKCFILIISTIQWRISVIRVAYTSNGGGVYVQ